MSEMTDATDATDATAEVIGVTSKGELLNQLIDTHLNIRTQKDELYEMFKRKEVLRSSFDDPSCTGVVKQRYDDELRVLEQRYQKVSKGIEEGERVTKEAAEVIAGTEAQSRAAVPPHLANEATASIEATNKLSTELDRRIQEFRQNLYTLDVLNEGHVAKLNKRIDGLSNRVGELQDTLNTVSSTLVTIFSILENK